MSTVTAPVLKSFVVFRDDAPPSPTHSMPNDVAEEADVLVLPTRPTSPLAPLSTVNTNAAAPLTVFCPDKENINPVTGLRATSENVGPKQKKRKPTVLATKAYIPPATKKSKEGKKPATSTKSKSSEKSSKRALGSRWNGASNRARRSPSLPKVNEEDAEGEACSDNEGHPMSQAAIDARCYELTVLPLADLSKAYEQAPALEGEHAQPERFRSRGVSKDVDEKQSNYAPSERAPSPTPSAATSRSSSPAPSEAAFSTFSTPERKRIYSAFTFSSPSPTSARYAALRGSSVERFSDPAFEL